VSLRPLLDGRKIAVPTLSDEQHRPKSTASTARLDADDVVIAVMDA
jgi:hypothetical protein